MRGHWQSGTRKLNRHYQSGKQVTSDIFYDMLYGLNGIEYGDFPERYNGSPESLAYFHAVRDDNIIVAPAYRLISIEDLNTTYTEETKEIRPANVSVFGRGQDKTARLCYTGYFKSSSVRKIQNLGYIKAVPTFGYYQPINSYEAPVARWADMTAADQTTNQNGIQFGNCDQIGEYAGTGIYIRGYKKGGYEFGDVYGNKTVRVLTPVYEIIKQKYVSGEGDGTESLLTYREFTPGDVVSTKAVLRLKQRQGAKRIPTLAQAVYPSPLVGHVDSDSGHGPINAYGGWSFQIVNGNIYIMTHHGNGALYAAETGSIMIPFHSVSWPVNASVPQGFYARTYPPRELFVDCPFYGAGRVESDDGYALMLRLERLEEETIILKDYVINEPFGGFTETG